MDHLVSKMGYLETKMVSLFATIIPLILILVFSTATLGAHAIPTDEIKAAHAGLADVLTDEMPWDSLANGLPTVAKARALWPAGCHALKAIIPPEVAQLHADCKQDVPLIQDSPPTSPLIAAQEALDDDPSSFDEGRAAVAGDVLGQFSTSVRSHLGLGDTANQNTVSPNSGNPSNPVIVAAHNELGTVAGSPAHARSPTQIGESSVDPLFPGERRKSSSGGTSSDDGVPATDELPIVEIPDPNPEILHFEQFGTAMTRAFNSVHSRTRQTFPSLGDLRVAAQPILAMAKALNLHSPMDLALSVDPPFLTDRLADALSPYATEAISLATTNLFEAIIRYGRGTIDSWLNEQRIYNIMERSRAAVDWEPGMFHSSDVWKTSSATTIVSVSSNKRTPSAKMLASAMKALENARKATTPSVSSSSTTAIVESELATTKLSEAMARQLEYCHAFLLGLGIESPRFRELYGDDGKRIPSDTELQIMRDTFQEGRDNYRVIANHLKNVKETIAWAATHQVTIWGMPPLLLAARLRDGRGRGASVPSQIFQSLAWFHRCFGPTKLDLAHAMVQAQKNANRQQIRDAAQKAPMATPGMVLQMQAHLFDPNLNFILKIFAGLMIVLALGCMRFSDAIYVRGLVLKDDAILGICWHMKRKRKSVPFAVPRYGVDGADWGGEWFKLLEAANLPGPDFLLPNPSTNFSKWIPKSVCSYASALRAMRVLLMEGPAAMAVHIAIMFTLHSWRHLLPVCSRQLNQTNDATTEIGHWEKGSDMPHHYDSIACGKELMHKFEIMDALRKQWRPAAAGQRPKPVPSGPLPEVPARTIINRTPKDLHEHITTLPEGTTDHLIGPVDPESIRKEVQSLCEWTVKDTVKNWAAPIKAEALVATSGAPETKKRKVTKAAAAPAITHIVVSKSGMSGDKKRHVFPGANVNRARYTRCGHVNVGTPTEPSKECTFYKVGDVTHMKELSAFKWCGHCSGARIRESFPPGFFDDTPVPEEQANDVASSSSDEEDLAQTGSAELVFDPDA